MDECNARPYVVRISNGQEQLQLTCACTSPTEIAPDSPRPPPTKTPILGKTPKLVSSTTEFSRHRKVVVFADVDEP